MTTVQSKEYSSSRRVWFMQCFRCKEIGPDRPKFQTARRDMNEHDCGDAVNREDS